MISKRDLNTLATISYLVDGLGPALEAKLKKVSWENNDYCTTRIKNDLRLIRRLALNISKNL